MLSAWNILCNNYPAYGKVCDVCGLKNHCARVCFKKTKKTHGIEKDEDIDESTFVSDITLNTTEAEGAWYNIIKIGNADFKLKVHRYRRNGKHDDVEMLRKTEFRVKKEARMEKQKKTQ